MKKIMKKALSLMLALVMVFSLAPMTASANEGNTITEVGTDAAPIVLAELGDYSVVMGSDSFTYLKWIADGSGTFKITDVVGQGMFEVFSVAGKEIHQSSASVTEGDVVIIQGTGRPLDYVNVKFTLAEGEDAGNELKLGPNAVDVVVQGGWCNGTEVTFTAPADGWYLIKPADGELFADVYGEDYSYYVESFPYKFELEENEIIKFLVCTTDTMYNYSEQTIDLVVEETEADVLPIGTEEEPVIMNDGENKALVIDEAGNWFKYVATSNGTLWLTMKGEDEGTTNGWCYDGYEYYTLFEEKDDSMFGESGYSSEDEEVKNLITIDVEAYDAVYLKINTPDDTEGIVVFNVYFEEEEVLEYVVDEDTELTLGNNKLELNSSVPTTIYAFNPTEPGVYTITTDNGLVGYWGGSVEFVFDQTGDFKTETLEHEYETVGSSIMIGITGEGEATVTIEKTGEVEKKPTIPTIVYKNEFAPEYSDEYEVELPNTVDIEVEEELAVLGDDGYYHLGSANGPVLFVDLACSIMSLHGAAETGSLTTYVVDEENNFVAEYSYNEAFAEYYAVCAMETNCYPLNEDLATILKEVGEASYWYGPYGRIGGSEANGWLYACRYSDAITSLEVEVVETENDGVTDIVIGNTGKITAESLSALLELNQNETVVITVYSGENAISYEFIAEDMELIDGKDAYDFAVEVIDDFADATEDKAAIEKDRFVLRVNYSYEGKFPATAKISITVGKDYAGQTLKYYKVNADGTLKYICDATIDTNGSTMVTQDSCSDYVFLKDVAKTEKPDAPIEAPKTGDATNFALWIAVLGLGVVAIAGSVVMKKREF